MRRRCRYRGFVRLSAEAPAAMFPSKKGDTLVDGPFTVVDGATGRRIDIGHSLRFARYPVNGQAVLGWEWEAADRVHQLPAGTVDVVGGVIVFTPDDPARPTWRFEPTVAADRVLLFPEPDVATDGALRGRLRRLWGLGRQG